MKQTLNVNRKIADDKSKELLGDYGLLGCEAVEPNRNMQTFRQKVGEFLPQVMVSYSRSLAQ